MVHRKDFLVQRSMYSSSTARMEADGIYISTNMETATDVFAVRSNTAIAVMLQSTPIDKLMPTSCAGIARNPHKCGKELLLQSTVSASPLQLMRCQRWSCIQLLQALHSFACLTLLRERSLQCRGHSSATAIPMRLPSGCIATERAT